MADPSNQKQKNIIIIGGGIVGCTSAYFLSRHPAFDPAVHRITLLEAGQIAGGASGKAGGLLALWAYPSSIVPLSFRLHRELADEHAGAERWGYRGVSVGQVECKGRDFPPANGGSVKGRNGDEASVGLQKRSNAALAQLRAAGLPPDLDWVDAECAPSYESMGDPTTTAQVHPFRFTTSMAALAAQKGVDIRTGASVSAIDFSADGAAVAGVTFTHEGRTQTLPATDVVLAAGPWTRSLFPSAPIAALRAHSVTIRPSRPVSAYALFTHIRLPKQKKPSRSSGGQTVVTPEIYARPDNEVYACGEGDRLVPLPQSTDLVECDASRCQDIVEQVGAISAELRDGEVTARQACYLPNVVAGSGGPLVGLTGTKGLVLAAGHTCWGIQNGPGTGLLVSEFVFEGEARSAKIKGLDPRLVL